MERIRDFFREYPSQEKVALLLLSHGIRIEGPIAYCGDIALSDTAIGRAAGVDRRVVRTTIDKIRESPELMAIYSKLRSILLLSEVAPEIGCTTLEIIPTDASIPGILWDVTAVIFRAGVSVRQAVVDDPGFRNDAHLIVVVDGNLPPEFIPELKECRGVDRVIIR